LGILSFQILLRQALPIASEISLGDWYVYSAWLASVLALFDALGQRFIAWAFGKNYSWWFRVPMIIIAIVSLCAVYYYVYLVTYKKYKFYKDSLERMERPRPRF
jgi:membrane protein YdbS with pleckstrin-like domain